MPLTACFFTAVKRGPLIPDLRENSSNFDRDLFVFKFFVYQYPFRAKCVIVPIKAILWIVRFVCTLFCVTIGTCLFPLHIIYDWFHHNGVPACEGGACLTLFSPAALQKPGASLLLTLFRLLGHGFHHLDCSFQMISQFRLLLLIVLAIYMFFVWWGLRFFKLLFMPGWFFKRSLLCFWVGTPQAYPFTVLFWRMCVGFLTFFFFDTIP